MKVLTYNVNGIRAALKKGFLEFLQESNPDVVCLQETKAQPGDVPASIFEDLGYQMHWFSAQKKGYSGVAILSKQTPKKVILGSGHPLFDAEGRHITLDFGDLAIQSLYAPSGTTGDVRQQIKFEWMEFFADYQQQLRQRFPHILFCGDFNICNHPIDIHNPKANEKTSGFLPEERAWMTGLIQGQGLVDTFRHFHPDAAHQYTWWSLRAGSRARNLGWRIDYILGSPDLTPKLTSAKILPEALHSDHCPVELTIS